jgi:iron complex outermembrane receptor protein
MSMHAGYQYRRATKVANTTVSITDQDAYDLVDLGIAYTTANESWRFSVEGKNILDQEYRVAGYDFGATGATGGFSQIGFYGPPRTVSVNATYRY